MLAAAAHRYEGYCRIDILVLLMSDFPEVASHGDRIMEGFGFPLFYYSGLSFA